MPSWRSGEPAFHFAGPGDLHQLLLEAFGALLHGQGSEVDALQDAMVPPGDQGRVSPTRRLRINPGAILTDLGRLQLVQQRKFEPVRQVTLSLKLAQKLLDRAARNDH